MGIRLFLIIPLALVTQTEAKTWRYWPNIGCYNFNFERTVFFELTTDATELSTTEGLKLPVIVNSSIVPSMDNELQIQHTLTGSIRNSTTNTPEECITFCNSTGYAYAGLQEGIRCVCMNEHPLAKTDADKCNMACSGDGNYSCGGHWTMDVHQNPHYHSSNLTYIGCFKNSFNDLDRLLIEGEFNNFRNNTPDWCVAYCTSGGYDYAGLQYGSQCICTNSGPQGTSDAGQCTYGCAGDNSIKMCGGLGYINIFHTGAHKTTIDDWGCGNTVQDTYYQKWYQDMGHCGTTATTSAPGNITTVIYTTRDEGTQRNNRGNITVQPGVEYAVSVEILRNDLASSDERVDDITLDGNSIGGCNPDGGDYDCTFFNCPIAPATVVSQTGNVEVNMVYMGHSWDCDCDQQTWNCSRENSVPGRTPVNAVGRFLLTPLR